MGPKSYFRAWPTLETYTLNWSYEVIRGREMNLIRVGEKCLHLDYNYDLFYPFRVISHMSPKRTRRLCTYSWSGDEKTASCQTAKLRMQRKCPWRNLKSATPAYTQMIRKWNSLIADKEEILVVWIEDQTSHNIPLSQSLIQSKVLTSILWRLREGRKDTEGKFEPSRDCFMKFKERSCLHNIKA